MGEAENWKSYYFGVQNIALPIDRFDYHIKVLLERWRSDVYVGENNENPELKRKIFVSLE